MKKFNLAHLSDLHLGYSSGKKRIDENGFNIRENDGYQAYNKIVDQIVKEKVDAVLIAGDMFHSPRPKNHTILIAQEGVRKIARAGIPVYIIAGNHDATDVRAEVPSSKLIHEPDNNIFSYSDPYIVKEIHEGIFMHFLSHHAFVDQHDTMSLIQLQENKINILASHGSCYDTHFGQMLKTPNEPREVVIPEDIVNLPWDYTLLGHIHERGWIGSSDRKTDTAKRKQFYNGSILRRGFSDKVSPNGRGWTKWEIDLESKVFTPTMFTIEERPQFDMKPIEVEDKTPLEIEEEVVNQLKAIDKKINDDHGGFSMNSMPIVRQTLVGVNTITRLSLNLQKFNEYTSKYLSHSFRIVPDTNQLDTSSADSGELTKSGDIVSSFSEWSKKNLEKFKLEEDLKLAISTTAKEQLKLSRDELLTKED